MKKSTYYKVGCVTSFMENKKNRKDKYSPELLSGW